MRSSAIVFSYDSQRDVEYYIKNLERMGFGSMIVCAEGDLDLSRISSLMKGKNVDLIFNRERIGKSVAYNNALRHVSSEIVFLISGDVRFDPDIINKIVKCMKEEEIVIPRVKPFKTESLAGKVASFMWNVHDTCLDSDDQDYLKSGGEFLATFSKSLVNMPKVINDDEYICLTANLNGMKVRYNREIVVRNWVPENLKEILNQRIRINFGHLEMKRYFGKNSSLSLNFLHNMKKSLRIMKKHFSRYPDDILYILPALVLEVISIICAYMDLKRSRSHLFWKIVSRSHDFGKEN